MGLRTSRELHFLVIAPLAGVPADRLVTFEPPINTTTRFRSRVQFTSTQLAQDWTEIECQPTWNNTDFQQLESSIHEIVVSIIQTDPVTQGGSVRWVSRLIMVDKNNDVPSLAQASALDSEIAVQHLIYDDILMNIQGDRRHLAEACLRVWGYDRMAERLDRRIRDVSAIATSAKQQLDSRHQGVVQLILAGLGALALVECILSLISVAFTGTDQVPGGGFPGILMGVRAVNSDLLIFIAILLSIGLTLLLARRKGQ